MTISTDDTAGPASSTGGPPPTASRRTAKAALAAAAAAVLLLGGTGSLAVWSDTQSITGTPITSGELKLGTPDCGTGWLFGATGTTALTNQLIVPGNVLRKICTIDLVATGNLTADLGIGTAAFSPSNALTSELVPAAVFTVGGTPDVVHITSADDTGTGEIQATITVTFTGASATNASQALTSTLNAIAVTLTQT
jgi:alternate signal-mediated exported protein